MKKTTVLICISILSGFCVIQCKSKEKGSPPDGAIKPVPLPAIVPGFKFPEDSSVILSWVNNNSFPGKYDSASIYQHAWGIWAGLTDTTNQSYGGTPLLVFETWMGLNEVRDADSLGYGCDSVFKTKRSLLTRPKQFEHAANFTTMNAAKLAKLKLTGKTPPLTSLQPFTQWVTVSYSPDAACYAINNKIFNQSTINRYYTNGTVGNIPPFPSAAITIKPTYLVYNTNPTELLQVPVWLNSPNPPQALNPNQFAYCVYADPTNNQPANKKLIPALSSDTVKSDIANATCNLNDFIYFKVDSAMANLMNKQDSVQGMNNSQNGFGKAKAGSTAVLVGMHVTSKEISNWTWQTYYWVPDPQNPGTPSSQLAVKTRPAQLVGAAAHYATNAAYVMLTPNGATNTTTGAGSMIGFNPYLEGGFGPGVFGITNGFNASYTYGQQTNCMSCHALAVLEPAIAGASFGQYTTDQFINLTTDSLFKSQVRLDFAWSIQTALINDTVPYWKFITTGSNKK